MKAYVFFRGRSILFKEQGEVLLLRFANDLEDLGKVEMMPVLEGKRMSIMLAPLKPAAKKPDKPKDDSQKKGEAKASEKEGPKNEPQEAPKEEADKEDKIRDRRHPVPR